KLGLLVGLTAPMPGWGIYVSWSAPLLLVVLGVNVPVFRLLRRGVGQADERLTVREMVRFSAGDYAASGLWLTTIHCLPLLVLALTTAEDSAWYHLSWTVAYTLYLVTSAVGSALVAEGAHDPARLEVSARRAAGQALVIVVPAAGVVVLGAPLLLRLFGAEYANEATTLLRLVAASAVPHVVTGVYVNLERARRRIREVVLVYALLGTGVVGVSAVLVPRIGVTGAGIAWLGTQSLLALWLLATRLRDVWIGALPTPLLRALGEPSRRRLAARQHRHAQGVVAELTRRLGDPEDWALLHATPDLVVARNGDRVLKLPGSHQAELGRRRELNALYVLAGEPALAGWDVSVPRPLDHGTDGEQAWSIETAVPGRTGEAAMADGLAPDRLLRAGAEALAGLHRPTAQPVLVTEPLLRSWVDEPVTVVARTCPEILPALAEVAATLRLALEGRLVTVAWSHGDITPANLLVDDDGRVGGVVDWEGARADRLPELDLVTLIIATRASAGPREIGEVVLALLRRPWTEEEVAVLATGPNGDLPREVLVLLAWLHHVAANLAKSEAYAVHRVWLVRNVLDVAAAVGLPPAPTSGPVVVEPVPDPLVAVEATPAPTTEPVVEPDPIVLAAGSVVRATEPAARTRSVARTALPFAVPVVAVAVWVLALRGVDLRTMGDTGLVSVLPPAAMAALGLLVVGLIATVTRSRVREGLAAAHVGGLVAILYGTPPVLYGTLRYSWAWKHLGIVDYIDRVGAVDPAIEQLPVYHNWPGFFAGSHVLQDLVGADDAILIARWFPLVLALATVAAVVLLASTFTTDRRVVWLTAALFSLGNWVGQEYFSPQAFAYLLYLVALALALRLGRSGRRGGLVVLTIALLAVAIASSHQLTPAMLTIALVALAATRHPRVRPVAVVAGLATVTWALWAASRYVGENLTDAIDGFGQPLANADKNLAKSAGVSDGQALVGLAGRGIVLALGLLALIGLGRRWLAKDRQLAPIVLLAAPAILLAGNSFGGEILFRVFLFSLPLAAYFAAHALLDLPMLRGGIRSALAPLAVAAVLAPAFLLANDGKDGHYRFTPEEVAAAEWLYERAPDDSLLIEGSRNYPTQWRNYERITYLPIDREDPEVRFELQQRPIRTLTRWMSYDDYDAAYLLLTRSQRREATALGTRPVGLLEDLEERLRASRRFVVSFENRDAVIFELRSRT
ncbi:MAG TPA: phosphotransferase, partial [Acidimicrobiales bacterium]|nr:phosphotransferase [Acidimicrobiales bacterium]